MRSISRPWTTSRNGESGFRAWPHNVKTKNYDEVIREGSEIRDMYPEYVEDGSVYEFLADAYLAKGNKAAAMAQLERYSAIGGRSPYLIKKLASLQAEAGKKREAAATP